VARQRLQRLLAERFKLVVKRESREMPVYALVIAKNGHKMKESTQSDDDDGIRGSPGHWSGQHVEMTSLAKVQSGNIGRPVLDRTSLKGPLFKPRVAQGRFAWGTMKAEQAGVNPPDPNGPTIFTAFQEQLGLRLEATKGPVETIVIERVERPAAN
jgi:uncharacterized protein (TIGR03435 family)